MTTDEKQNKYAEKISLLLAKAESTTPEEAEAIMAKAQELMTLYAIDEQMIARASGKKVQEQIVEGTITYTGIFMTSEMNLAFAVARNNSCRAFYSDNKYAKPKNVKVHVFGFESDVRNVELLSTSLLLQMQQAMLRWSKTAPEMSPDLSKMTRYKARREFINGFAVEIGSRLYVAVQEGRKAAAASEAERSHVDVDAASTSVALVLKDRKGQVDDWFDTQYGKSLRSVSRRYSSSGSRGAQEAGRSAGRTANIGQPSVGGGRKSIGGGK